jgi:hypothetical protein
MNLTKLSLPLLAAALLGLGACTGAPTLGTASPLQAADPKATGGTSDPAAATTCKASTDPSGVPCKICVDSSGAISYDDCNGGASGAGGSGGSSGSGGTTAGDVKCVPTTDATTGAACKTCYAADGSYTSYCSAPPQNGSGSAGGTGGSGSTIVKCAATTDPSTGAACKTCYAADGSIVSNDCSNGGAGGSGGSGSTIVKCAPTTDPSTGATCKTCYAADGSVVSNDCSGGAGGTAVMCTSSTDPNGVACQTCYAPDGSISSNACTPPTGGASCVGATNIETGQVCKVCSDTTTGKLLFVDCPVPACVSPTTATPPPTK